MRELNSEHLKLQEELFEAIGVTKADRQIVHDLAKHAAREAVHRIDMIARTTPDPRMVNVVMISAMMLLGEAAENTINERMKSALARMPAELREKFDEIMAEDEPKPSKSQGKQDFDGNYQ